MRRRTFLSAGMGGLAGLLPARRVGATQPELVDVPRVPAELRTMAADEPAIIYSLGQQRIWVVDTGFRLLKTHLVSGRYGNPPPGSYRVFSKSPKSFSTNNPAVQWNYMVRFYITPRGNNIGFHQIPVRCSKSGCKPIQSVSQLGTPRSAGCVRQSAADAKWLYGWSKIGTLVVVVR